MQKRDLSNNKLPKIPANDTTLSSKLYSLTGLRIFQAKFMEELRYPRPPQKNQQILQVNNENFANTMPIKPAPIYDGFTGKDKYNESRVEKLRQHDLRGKQEKKEENTLKKRQEQRIRVLNGRPKGLRNLGNTCYLNAVLQSLMALEEFNSALEKEMKLKKVEKGLTAAYCRVLNGYRNCGDQEVINPSQFKSHMGRRKDRFAGSAQQDAQQFLTVFLEGINEEMNRVKVKPKYKELQGDTSKDTVKNIAEDWWTYFKQRDDSVICDYFQGQMESTIVCSQCNFKTVSFDNYWGLPLSFGQKGSSTLSDLMAGSFKTQYRLEDYSCQKCKKARTCSKIIKIFRLPVILVVQLKRFGYGWNKKQKIKERVTIPLQLSLKEVMSSESPESQSLYRLKSTIEHSGQLNFGHYTGHVYSQKDEKWYYADDECISQQNVDKDASQLYVLFYYKK